MKPAIFLALALMSTLAANANAQTPRDLDDLVDARASSGEDELEDRGYRHHKTMDLKNSKLSYWWNSRREACVAVTIKDGRFASILEQPEQMCEGSSSSHSTYDRDDRDYGEEGVTLYHDYNFRGGHETVYGDIPEMSHTSIGNDSLSSIAVPHGCSVTLYADNNYRGRSFELRHDESELGRTPVGNDSVSSMRVDCGGHSSRHSGSGSYSGHGVTLYHDYDFRGGSETVDHDIPDMAHNPIGNDSLSSIRVPPGCQVTLYSDNNYRGRSLKLYRDEAELGNTDVGNDSVSSMRVDCR